jgi:hypothetical protein
MEMSVAQIMRRAYDSRYNGRRLPKPRVIQMNQVETRFVRGRLAYLVLAIRCLWLTIRGPNG